MRRLILLFGLLGLLAGWPASSQAQVQQCISSAITSGTGDAMTIPHLPCAATSTLLITTFGATNITTTPTLQMLGGGLPLPIVFSDATPMTPGALTAGHTVLTINNGSEWMVVATSSGGGGGGGGTINSVSGGPTTVTGPATMTFLQGCVVSNLSGQVGVTCTGPPGGLINQLQTNDGAGGFNGLAVLDIARGGTNSTTASGTSLDNITGFSGTGLLNRLSAGTYGFKTAPSGTIVGDTDPQTFFNKTYACTANTCPPFDSINNGFVPASGGGTTNFLRADGAWASFAGGGTVTNGANLIDHAPILGDGGTTGIKSTAAMTNGQLLIGVSGGDPAPQTVLGDGTLSSGGALVITKTNGAAFTALATTAPAAAIPAFLGTPTSGNLAAALTDESGTGLAVFNNGPTLIAPDLGTPTALNLANATGLPVTTGVSGLGANVATFLATPSSANLRAALTDEAGTGAAYFVGGALGTPSSATLTNATGLPIAGITGFGSGVAAALAVNVGTAGSPVINSGALGTPASGSLTNTTGLPVSTGLSGAGTGVITALQVNVGTAGSFVVNGGALGTPSSGVLTNATGLPTGGLLDAAVTNAKLANMAGHTFKGNNTAGSAVPLDLTATELTAELNLFTDTLKGLVPLSGGGTLNFLRADGSWASPAGAGTVTNALNLTDHAIVLGDGGTTGIKTAAALTDSQLLIGATGADPTAHAMSQDCTMTTLGVVTCLKTNNVAFAALATTVPGTGVATYLATPSLANWATATTGLGTGTATALGVNVGSAGAVLVNGGVLGTPSSGTLTNATGLPTTGLVNAAVTYAKMQNGAATGLLGVNTGASPTEVTVGTGLTLSGGVLSSSAGGGSVTNPSNLTIHAPVIGGANGTTDVKTTAAMTNGQLLVGATGVDPVPQTVTGDISLTAGGVATIPASTVSNAKMANMAGHTYKGNNTGSAAAPADITNTQLTADLNLFSSSLKGLVPASGGGTANFLRADGGWASLPGSGVAGGQALLGIGNDATALAAGHYGYFTNAAFTAPRTKALPDSATQGAGTIFVWDKQRTLSGSNTLTLCAAGTNTVDGGAAGSCATVLNTAGATIVLQNDGAGAWSTLSSPGTLTTTDGTHTVTNTQSLAFGSGLVVGGGAGAATVSAAPAIFVGNTAGSANTYTIAAPNPTGYTLTDQFMVCGTISATNTGASTLNVAGTGAKAISKQTPSGLVALSGGELSPNNTQYCWQYNAAATAYVLTTVLANSLTKDAAAHTVTQAEWANGQVFDFTTSQTLILPVATGLAPTGGIIIKTEGNTSVTLTPNAADGINGGTISTSVTVPGNMTTVVTTTGTSGTGAFQVPLGLVAGSNVTLTQNSNGTTTVAATGGGGGITCPTGFTLTGSDCVWTKTPGATGCADIAVNCIAFTGLVGNEYTLRCRNLIFGSGGISGIQYGEGGTPTWNTGATSYVSNGTYQVNGGAVGANTNTANAFMQWGEIDTSGTLGTNLTAQLHGLATAGVNHGLEGSLGSHATGSGNYSAATSSGYYTGDTNAITAIRLADTQTVPKAVTGGSCSLYSHAG